MSLFSDINIWDVGKTREKVKNHELIGEWCLTSQHGQTDLFYCFYKIIITESIRTLFLANDWITGSPNFHQNAWSTNQVASKLFEHYSRSNGSLNEWNGQHGKTPKNSQGNCFDERNFQEKNIKLMLDSSFLRQTFNITSKNVSSIHWIRDRAHSSANMLPTSTIIWLHLEVLFVWFIWAVNLVCLTTLLSLDIFVAVYLLSSSATETKYRYTGRDRLSGGPLW